MTCATTFPSHDHQCRNSPCSFYSTLLFSLSISLAIVAAVSEQPCTASSTSSPPCPPFSSPPPFPFSSSPGCGHPSFQLNCSSPHSLISINNLSFALLHFDPNSSTLLLAPHPSETSSSTSSTTASSTTASSGQPSNCTSFLALTLPLHPINLSSSPFRFSETYCSRLSYLRSCSPPTNCSQCPWHCNLVKNPLQLLDGCRSTASSHQPLSDQGCQTDILDFLDHFLRMGFQVEYDESQDAYFSSCRDCRAKRGICGFNSSDPEKKFVCFHSQSTFSIRDPYPSRIAILCSIFTLLCLVLVILVLGAIFRSRHLRSLSEEDPTALFLRRHRSSSLLPPVFSYEELESSTNRFDPKRKIGDGGFGSVYLGQLHDGRIVAVKYLHHHRLHRCRHGKAFSAKSFCNEILILSSINHPNLVRLHGYCSDPRGLLLVYDYVPNGTLFDHLHGVNRKKPPSLTWRVRLDVALQTALALEYLHFSVRPAIVHRDITSANIFVEKDMRIKVGDFGLSRLLSLPETTSSSSDAGFVWTGPQGTPGYLDPDYHRSFRLTQKSDVYSFGVVLLELVSGLKAVDQRRDKREMALADLVVSRIHMGLLHQVLDPVLVVDGRAVDGVEAVAELAFRCVAADKDDRPDMKEVVEELKRIRIRALDG